MCPYPPMAMPYGEEEANSSSLALHAHKTAKKSPCNEFAPWGRVLIPVSKHFLLEQSEWATLGNHHPRPQSSTHA